MALIISNTKSGRVISNLSEREVLFAPGVQSKINELFEPNGSLYVLMEE